MVAFGALEFTDTFVFLQIYKYYYWCPGKFLLGHLDDIILGLS